MNGLGHGRSGQSRASSLISVRVRHSSPFSRSYPQCYSVVMVIGAYLVLLIACISMQVPLLTNPNRAGEYRARNFRHFCPYRLPRSRFPRAGSVPPHLPLWNEEFDPLINPWTWTWLREAQLYPSLGGSRHVHRRHHPRSNLDQQPHRLRPPYPRATEGDVWCRCVRCPVRPRSHIN